MMDMVAIYMLSGTVLSALIAGAKDRSVVLWAVLGILLAYTTDGRLEIDNNPAENALRAVALGRRNWTFAGADCGGERAAAMYTLLETCRLNGVNPQEWLADVLGRIGQGHPVNRLDELLPWSWRARGDGL